jgi:hypothetical protein
MKKIQIKNLENRGKIRKLDEIMPIEFPEVHDK